MERLRKTLIVSTVRRAQQSGVLLHFMPKHLGGTIWQERHLPFSQITQRSLPSSITFRGLLLKIYVQLFLFNKPKPLCPLGTPKW